MIIKIKSHKRASFGPVLNYMVNNKDRLIDKKGKSFALIHNLKGNSIKHWEKQFKENEMHRLRNRIDSVKLTHEILSWHKDDAKHLTLAKMEELAREYIQKRNPSGMYIAVPHFDKDHYHVHICASGVEYKTGKSLRLSKPDLQRLKVDIQNYQQEKFPELSKSIVEHGKKDKTRLTDKEYQLKLRTGRETEKEHLLGILKTCYKKSDSRETFLQLIKECGLETYERSGMTTGVISAGIKFRFNRLGYTEERFEYLDRVTDRKKELGETRLKEKPTLSPPKRLEPVPQIEQPITEEEISEAIPQDIGQEEPITEERENELGDIRGEREESGIALATRRFIEDEEEEEEN